MRPPADYQVVTDEELIEGLSFLAYRRISTVMFVPAQSGSAVEMVTIDPFDLQAAREQDAAMHTAHPGRWYDQHYRLLGSNPSFILGNHSGLTADVVTETVVPCGPPDFCTLAFSWCASASIMLVPRPVCWPALACSDPDPLSDTERRQLEP